MTFASANFVIKNFSFTNLVIRNFVNFVNTKFVNFVITKFVNFVITILSPLASGIAEV